MTLALILLVVGAGLLAAEMLSGDLVLAMLGIGVLAGSGAQAIGDNIYVSGAVFAVVSIGLLVLARPALKRRFLLGGPGIKTGIDAMVGAKALALSAVDDHTGRVRIGGEEWAARPLVEGQRIEAGQTVTVVQISGATAIVATEP